MSQVFFHKNINAMLEMLHQSVKANEIIIIQIDCK